MNKKSMRSEAMLILTAMIWGTAFVAQSLAADYIEPFTYNSIRTLIGGVALLPVIYLLNRSKSKEMAKADLPTDNKKLIIGGIICGIVLCIAGALQQIGIQYTTVGKAGFITALYIIIVPILGIFFKRRPSVMVWISVLLAVCGMYLLCINEGFSIGKGDVLVILCAFFFSIHILVIDYFSPFVDGVKLSCLQFFTCSILSAIVMFGFEHPQWGSIFEAWFPLLYSGIMSCGIAYTLQIIGQKNVNSVIASLIMSLEAVFAAIAGWIILHESLSVKELIGCMLVFAGIILTQLPVDHLSVKKNLKTV